MDFVEVSLELDELEAEPTALQSTESTVGTIKHRPVCNQANKATTNLLIRSGCTSLGLEKVKWVCNPSMVPNRLSTPERDYPASIDCPVWPN